MAEYVVYLRYCAAEYAADCVAVPLEWVEPLTDAGAVVIGAPELVAVVEFRRRGAVVGRSVIA
jgi:hypothetical protein